VTIALWASRKFSAKDVIPYIIAQLIGATIASFLFAATAGQDAVTVGGGGLGATDSLPGHNGHKLLPGHPGRGGRDLPVHAVHHGYGRE